MFDLFNDKNYILEIQNPLERSNTDFPESVYPIYNLAEWRLLSENSATTHDLLKCKENELIRLKKQSKNYFGTIVASVAEAKLAANYADILYIPGEICRQSDVLIACAQTSCALVIERGVFLAPPDIQRIIEKTHSRVAIVDCGSTNGYGDAILDPRSLFTLKKLAVPFGVHLSDLLAPEGTTYSHRPQWLSNYEFIDSFVQTAKAFDSFFYVIKNYGKGAISRNSIIEKI